jgi:hypothetical protein
MPRELRRLLLIRDLFFWIGVVFAVASLSVVASSNTLFISQLEHRQVPLSGMLAGAAILALMVAERCNAVAPQPSPPACEPVRTAVQERAAETLSSPESETTPEISTVQAS